MTTCAVRGPRISRPPSEASREALLDLIGKPNGIGIAATQVLRSDRDEDTARLLAKLLGDASTSSSARCSAAELLGRLSPHAAIAVPALIRASQDRDADIRESAVRALEKLGPDAREAAPALGLLLSDADPNLRIKAASALYAVGGSEEQAVKSLIAESHNTDYSVHGFAVYELGQVGKKEKPAVEALIASLGDDYSYVRVEAVRALKAVGRPVAIKAVPELGKLLSDPDPEVREAAKEALTDLKSK